MCGTNCDAPCMRTGSGRPSLQQAYRLAERIGTGGTAEVWRAVRRDDGQTVTIKLLRADLAADERARARLAAELAAAGRVSHEGILPLLHGSLGDPRPYLVFEDVAGETLADRLARDTRLEPWLAARTCARLAAALAAVHDAGLVHRDVKPGNVLLGRDGQVRLLDFGISTPAGTPAELSVGAGPGLTVGTLPYLAPEQLAGQPAQPANDVFALGAVLYQALAGRPPFVEGTAPDLARAHRLAPARVLDAPASLVTMALAALDVRPEFRPTARQMAEQLESWLSGRLLSEAPTAAVPATRAARRVRPERPSVLTAGVLTGLALAVASALALAPASSGPAALDLPRDDRSAPPTAAAALEPRVPDEPTGRADSRPVALVGQGEHGPAAEPAAAKPKPQAGPAEGKAKRNARPGKEKGEEKAGKGKGKAGDKGKGKGKGGERGRGGR